MRCARVRTSASIRNSAPTGAGGYKVAVRSARHQCAGYVVAHAYNAPEGHTNDPASRHARVALMLPRSAHAGVRCAALYAPQQVCAPARIRQPPAAASSTIRQRRRARSGVQQAYVRYGSGKALYNGCRNGVWRVRLCPGNRQAEESSGAERSGASNDPIQKPGACVLLARCNREPAAGG